MVANPILTELRSSRGHIWSRAGKQMTTVEIAAWMLAGSYMEYGGESCSAGEITYAKRVLSKLAALGESR